MRMRKLPWAEEFLAEAEVVVKQPQENVGKWKELLACETLHVEVGTGKGDYWIQMAQQYADEGWIGIEKNSSVAALAVCKYTKLENPGKNMLYIQNDAESIQSWFAEGEVDVLHLNFSDPWPKKRAHKKRLSNRKFIEQYAHILNENGEIQMKTDNSSLFEYSLLEFQNAGWFLWDVSVDFRRCEHAEDVITEYEHRFMEKGQPIYRAVWKKKMKENA